MLVSLRSGLLIMLRPNRKETSPEKGTRSAEHSFCPSSTHLRSKSRRSRASRYMRQKTPRIHLATTHAPRLSRTSAQDHMRVVNTAHKMMNDCAFPIIKANMTMVATQMPPVGTARRTILRVRLLGFKSSSWV